MLARVHLSFVAGGAGTGTGEENIPLSFADRHKWKKRTRDCGLSEAEERAILHLYFIILWGSHQVVHGGAIFGPRCTVVRKTFRVVIYCGNLGPSPLISALMPGFSLQFDVGPLCMWSLDLVPNCSCHLQFTTIYSGHLHRQSVTNSLLNPSPNDIIRVDASINYVPPATILVILPQNFFPWEMLLGVARLFHAV